MKVLIIPVPNMVPNEELTNAINNFFNEIGVATSMHIIEEGDATPHTASAKTQLMKAVDKVISYCGNGDDEIAFKSKFRALVINGGDINFELLDILTARKTKKEAQYLADNHLIWLPQFADRMLKACTTMYGENV